MSNLLPVPTQPPALAELDDKKPVKSAVAATLTGFALLLGCASAVGFWVLVQAPALVFAGIESLLLWSCVVAVIHYLYLKFQKGQPLAEPEAGEQTSQRPSRFATIWQWMIYLSAIAAAAKCLLPSLYALGEVTQAPVDTLRLSAVIYLATGCVLYLYTSYARALQERLATGLLNPALYVARIVFAGCIATAATLFAFLSANYDYTGRLGQLMAACAGVLAIEPLFRFAGRFYQPRSLRKIPAPIGTSFLLDALFGTGHGAAGLLRELEELLGTRLGEVWILRFLRQAIVPVLFAGLLVAWLSTCFSSVPIGSRGVLISFGKYENEPVKPGLHLTLPWPFQQIVPIQTERLREIALGFDKDLANAVLWTEKHVEGEKNLLVDNGEGMLAINVPIFYRIANPVTYLKTTTDAEMALKSIAERKLTQIATAHESFHFMTEDRQDIANALREGVQEEVNRLDLGLEVTFVGLKDIHPPVSVAPAYQKVVSAQEEMEAMIDNATAYEARTLPQAKAQAETLITTAEADCKKRVLQSTGEATRFQSLIAPEMENPQIFRLRLRYDTLGEALVAPAKTIVGLPAEGVSDYFLDLRPGGNGGSFRGIVPP